MTLPVGPSDHVVGRRRSIAVCMAVAMSVPSAFHRLVAPEMMPPQLLSQCESMPIHVPRAGATNCVERRWRVVGAWCGRCMVWSAR